MKTQKGFIIPLLIIIIAALAIGGGFYIHSRNQKMAEQAQLNANASTTDDVRLNNSSSTSSSSVDNSIVGKKYSVATINLNNSSQISLADVVKKTGDKVRIQGKVYAYTYLASGAHIILTDGSNYVSGSLSSANMVNFKEIFSKIKEGSIVEIEGRAGYADGKLVPVGPASNGYIDISSMTIVSF